MSEQPTLFGDQPPLEKLGPAQQAILDELRQHGTLDEDEAGAILHHRRGKHGPDERCQWCTPDGRQVLLSLRRRKLARKPRSGGWQPSGVRDAVSPADTGEIPY